MALEPGALVVVERRRNINVLWGFLTAVFAGALVRLYGGPTTGLTRIVLYVVFGVLLAGSVAAWVWFRRHPGRLEISRDVITFSHRGQRGSVQLFRTGDLYVHTSYVGGTNPLHFLKVAGSDEAVPIMMFDRRELEEACRAAGWRFVSDDRDAA